MQPPMTTSSGALLAMTAVLIERRGPCANGLLTCTSFGLTDRCWDRRDAVAWEPAMAGDYDHYLWLNDDIILHDGAVCQLLDSRDAELESWGWDPRSWWSVGGVTP